MARVETRVDIATLKIDATNYRLSRITDLLESLSREIAVIRERQNMLLKKQDMLHSTIAG